MVLDELGWAIGIEKSFAPSGGAIKKAAERKAPRLLIEKRMICLRVRQSLRITVCPPSRDSREA
jgi:hypothetical protein